MAGDREFWIETTDKTFLYYRVKARSSLDAMEKYLGGEAEYVGCNDNCNEELTAVLEERPHVDWK
jgi:hypothetical protein